MIDEFSQDEAMKGFNVDSCFVVNAINLQREMARNDEFRQIVESGNSIYKYYVKNHVRFPELLRHNFFSKYEDRKMEDGVEVREFWRVKDYYMLLEFCQSQGISLCVAPTAYAELTFNPRKPETGYKDFTLVNSKEFRKLFKCFIF